jgi:hypothetical protein
MRIRRPDDYELRWPDLRELRHCGQLHVQAQRNSDALALSHKNSSRAQVPLPHHPATTSVRAPTEMELAQASGHIGPGVKNWSPMQGVMFVLRGPTLTGQYPYWTLIVGDASTRGCRRHHARADPVRRTPRPSPSPVMRFPMTALAYCRSRPGRAGSGGCRGRRCDRRHRRGVRSGPAVRAGTARASCLGDPVIAYSPRPTTAPQTDGYTERRLHLRGWGHAGA